ncbi:MAG: aminotransferase class III-fold pyridoxal phosphate-dependent enzyme [Pseudomonadota bacterium]
MTTQHDISSGDQNWLKANNGKHMLHSMQPQALLETAPPVIIKRGDGVYVTDIDGKRYLDCQGGLWCVNTGHGRKEINEAITGQLEELAYYTTFPGSNHGPAIELSTRLCEVAGEENIKRVMFSSGGSDAVESALKIARQYWKIEGQPERTKFLSLRNGYHGLHFGGMSAGGAIAWRRNYEPLLPGFFQVESPHVYRSPLSQDPEELAGICALLMRREIEHQGPDTIAALIAEPVQGAGGVIVPHASYWPMLRAICDDYGILMISDEVVTGLGRSGSLFGARGWGVKPDMMTMAKGLTSGYVPLGATLINDRINTAFERADSEFNVFMHGYTYSGHPVACAAGLASLDLTLREDLTGNAGAVGDYLIGRLRDELFDIETVGDIRGKGLMIAVELVKDRESHEAFGPTDSLPPDVSGRCLEAGVMVRTIVNKFIISPPLTFSTAHADELVSVLKDSLVAALNA